MKSFGRVQVVPLGQYTGPCQKFEAVYAFGQAAACRDFPHNVCLPIPDYFLIGRKVKTIVGKVFPVRSFVIREIRQEVTATRMHPKLTNLLVNATKYTGLGDRIWLTAVSE